MSFVSAFSAPLREIVLSMASLQTIYGRQQMRSIGRHGGHGVAKQTSLVQHSMNPTSFLSEHPVDPVDPV